MKRLPVLLVLSLAACVSAQVDRGPGPECADIDQRVLAASANGDPGGLGASEQKPSLRNQRYIERRMSDSLAVLELDSVPQPVVLRYRVSKAGITERVVVAQSSGSAAFDSVGVWAMGFAEHAPARLDGCPVAVWVEVPLTAHLPPRRRPPADAPRP